MLIVLPPGIFRYAGGIFFSRNPKFRFSETPRKITCSIQGGKPPLYKINFERINNPAALPAWKRLTRYANPLNGEVIFRKIIQMNRKMIWNQFL